VDNLNDPLTANQTAWSQSSDQYYASLADSSGLDPDLYRTTYLYDERGAVTDTIEPAENQKPYYSSVVTSTKNGNCCASSLTDYWRLGEPSGSTAADLGSGAHTGTYTSVALGDPGA